MASIKMNMGLNSASDRSYLAPGELILATGAYYKPGDTQRLWKMLGRTSYGDAWPVAQSGVGVVLCAFDTAANDRLVVNNDNGEYHSSVVSATDSTAGTFTTLTTGLITGATVLSWAHFDDVWYLGDDRNAPFALKSDGTFRKMGLRAPEGQMTSQGSSNTIDEQPTVATFTGTEWADTSRIFDDIRASTGEFLDDISNPYLSTFGYTDIRGAYDQPTDILGTTHSVILSGFTANTGNDRFLDIDWGLATGFTFQSWDHSQGPFRPGTDRVRFDVNVRFEISTNNGGAWADIDLTRYEGEVESTKMSIAVADGADISNYQVRISLIQNAELFVTADTAVLLVYNVHITNRGWQEDITTDVGLYYAVAQAIPSEGLIGPLSAPLFVVVDAKNVIRLTLPQPRDAGRTGAITNAAATHWIIYRTYDGGPIPNAYRQIAQIPIDQTTWIDTFFRPISSEAGAVPPFLKIQISESAAQFYVSNTPPPPFKAIVEYENFLVALSALNPRELAYSLPNRPEYWPTLYRITDFPLKEHDQLQAMGVAGDLLIVGAKEAIIVLNGLPEVEAQLFPNASMTVLRGAPGCVGPYAMREYSLHGEPRVMWVSEQGVYETNGNQVYELSTQLDWPATVNQGTLSKSWLHWDKDDQIMEMGVDTTGNGLVDRSYFFHMADEHKKGNLPKITGPHRTQLTNKVSGLANDGRYRIYALDNDDTGEVYHEKDGGADAGKFFNTSSELPFDAQTGRLYGPDLKEWAVDFPTIRHTSWGVTALAMTWTSGRDEAEESNDVNVVLTLTTQRSTKFAIARSGEWHQVRWVHNGDASASGAMGIIDFGATLMGETGDTKAT